jgi:hypothetical protein
MGRGLMRIICSEFWVWSPGHGSIVSLEGAVDHVEPRTDTDSRDALCADPEFAKAFLEAKRRVRQMEIRYVEERDPLRQTLLEIYVAVVLKTPYNDFETH